MHWLQALDTTVFHFINGTLGNPFFDWLMPRLSGAGVPWLPALVALAAGLIFFGRARARICALLAVLTVAVGDPLIINNLKHAFLRPRPCVALADTVQRLGCSSSGSFPSAHSANWFAATMVVFLFYRRSWRFMLPMAAAVAFSRVYCGVHYPGDVLGGALLGASYGAGLVWLAQRLWNGLGRRAFPAWHAHTPDLRNPGTGAATAPPAGPEWLRLGYALIGLTLIGHWIFLGSGLLNLSEDEAYQWLWSKHLALSYYSKPPGIAYAQWFGTSLCGDTELGVRFLSPVCAALLGWLMLRLVAREGSPRAAFFVVVITLATPLLMAGSVLMTIDPPLVLCWMWAVVAGWRAVQPDGRTGDWINVGCAVGLGFLFKYTAGLELICFALYLAAWPPARTHLRRPGPWLALGIFALCTLPVIIWNSQHGWATVHHLAGNAGLHGRWQPTLRYFVDFTGAEFGLLNPVFFVAALWSLAAAWRKRQERPVWFYLFCLGAPLFLGYWAYTLHSRVLPNWPVAAVPPMFCLMALHWREVKWNYGPALTIGLLIGIVMAVFLHSTDLLGKLVGQPLPGDLDASHRVRAWRQTAAVVEAERVHFDPNAFIIADHYGITGLFTFYSPAARDALRTGTPLVYYEYSEGPDNQLYFWDEYHYWNHCHGRNAIFVTRLDPYRLPPGWLGRWLRHESPGQPIPRPTVPLDPTVASEFASVTNLGIREIYLGDRVFQRVQLWGCYHLK